VEPEEEDYTFFEEEKKTGRQNKWEIARANRRRDSKFQPQRICAGTVTPSPSSAELSSGLNE
jgi:hypothetical protein